MTFLMVVRPLSERTLLRHLNVAGPALHLLRSPHKSRSSSRAAAGNGKRKVLFEQSLNVPSFGGSLWTKTPFDVRVSPIGTHEFPNLDRAFVHVSSDDLELQKEDMSVEVSQEAHKLSVKTENVNVSYDQLKAVRQEIKLPMVHNINVEAVGKASILAEDFIESNYCHLQSEDGDICASGIKTGTLSIQSGSGEVMCSGHIQGNIAIKTISGNIIGDKRLTGQALEVSTESGDIRLASCYSDYSKFSTNTGSMNLRNLHHEAYIAVYERGNVTVQGLDGSANIFVKRGDVTCHVSRIRAESRIHVETGDVTLKMSENYPIKISIEANDIFPDAKFKRDGVLQTREGSKTYSCSLHPDKFSPNILIIAENGNVMVESQDWAASLGLKIPITYGKDDKINI